MTTASSVAAIPGPQHTFSTDLIRERFPDLLVMDLALRCSDGMELLQELETQGVQVPVLVLSMYEDAVHAEHALQAGARGYVPKSEASSEIMRAMRKVLAGEVYLNERMTSELIQRMAANSPEPRIAIISALSERELRVLRLIGLGKDTHEMAQELGLCERTIRTLRWRIKYRLSAKDLAELYHWAADWMNELKRAEGAGSFNGTPG